MAFPMKQKILIALDGERDSEWAFDWYCNNLHGPGNSVIIVSCSEIGVKLATIAPEAISNEDESAIEVFIEEENTILAETVSKYQKKLRSAMLVGKVLASCNTSPSEVILNTAAAEEMNMIIIGSKGCSLHRQGVGSVCNYLVSHSTIPVIVCRHPDAVNDGYVSKYVVDHKTLRLIPRRRSQRSTEHDNILKASTLSSPLYDVSPATHNMPEVEEDIALSVQNTERQIQSEIPDANVCMTDTRDVYHTKIVTGDLNNEETQENHTSQKSNESISTEMTTNDSNLLSEEAKLTERTEDVENDDLNKVITENTTTETLVENDNLQTLDDNGNKEFKVQNTVPKLSTKDVSILLSTRLNKSSIVGTPQIEEKTTTPSSSKTTFNSYEEEGSVTSDVNSTVSRENHDHDNKMHNSSGIMTKQLENKTVGHKESDSDDNDCEDEENNISSAEKRSCLSPKHKGHKC